MDFELIQTIAAGVFLALFYFFALVLLILASTGLSLIMAYYLLYFLTKMKTGKTEEAKAGSAQGLRLMILLYINGFLLIMAMFFSGWILVLVGILFVMNVHLVGTSYEQVKRAENQEPKET